MRLLCLFLVVSCSFKIESTPENTRPKKEMFARYEDEDAICYKNESGSSISCIKKDKK